MPVENLNVSFHICITLVKTTWKCKNKSYLATNIGPRMLKMCCRLAAKSFLLVSLGASMWTRIWATQASSTPRMNACLLSQSLCRGSSISERLRKIECAQCKILNFWHSIVCMYVLQHTDLHALAHATARTIYTSDRHVSILSRDTNVNSNSRNRGFPWPCQIAPPCLTAA